MRFLRFKFDAESILHRKEFFNGAASWNVCGVLSQLIWFAVNTLVLAIVLTGIDYYFNQAAAPNIEALIKLNGTIAITCLLILWGIFIALNNLFAWVFLSFIFSKNSYEKNLKLFVLVLSVIVVYVMKSQAVATAGLIFSYPVAVIIFQVFITMSLRAGVNSYGLRCA